MVHYHRAMHSQRLRGKWQEEKINIRRTKTAGGEERSKAGQQGRELKSCVCKVERRSTARGFGATQKCFGLDKRSRPAGESLGGDILACLVPGAISRASADSRVHALALGRHDRWIFFSEKLLPLLGSR